MPEDPKELWYFDVERNFRAWTLQDYLRYFEPASTQTAIGEATPGYLWCAPEHSSWGSPSHFRTGIPHRVHSALGSGVKLIAVLRDPVTRALSAFLHHRRKGRIPENAMLSSHYQQDGIVHMGFYSAHLARWTETFPKENFKVVTYEELFSNPETLEKLQSFLNVHPLAPEELRNKRVNEGFGFHFDRNGVVDSAGVRIATDEDIHFLRQTYASDTKQLVQDWGIDVGTWM